MMNKVLSILSIAVAATLGEVAATKNDADAVDKGYLSLIGGSHVRSDPMFLEALATWRKNTEGATENAKKNQRNLAVDETRRCEDDSDCAGIPKCIGNPGGCECVRNKWCRRKVGTRRCEDDGDCAELPKCVGNPGGCECVRDKCRKKRACDPADVELLDYPQWQAEVGYWIGEYTLLRGDGDPFVSSSWNYPYDHYKGFITGNVVGNSYRQRNVFLYPPQTSETCAVTENMVIGNGACGTNGNARVFTADQSATTCSANEELGGDIAGVYLKGPFELPTHTELVGRDNALLYQVFLPGAAFGLREDVLMQSQLTTITMGPGGQMYRTRTAQGFDAFGNVGTTTYASYYRERRVDSTEFYAELENVIAAYGILAEDLCTWDGSGNVVANVTGSFDACVEHLETSFEL